MVLIFSERKIFTNWRLIYSVSVNRVGTYKNIKLLSIICKTYYVGCSNAGFPSPAAHTTETSNWDITEGNSEE